MKANELMLGDWVLINEVPKKIQAVDGVDDEIMAGDEMYCLVEDRCHSEDKVTGIPLTPEILEKNGFENDFYEEESIADYHTIRLQGYSLKNNIDVIDEYLITWCNGSLNVTTNYHGCVQKEIAYVHELQHALRLCKIDKTIEL